MLSKADKESIISIAKKYKVSRVLLFGSSASMFPLVQSSSIIYTELKKDLNRNGIAG